MLMVLKQGLNEEEKAKEVEGTKELDWTFNSLYYIALS